MTYTGLLLPQQRRMKQVNKNLTRFEISSSEGQTNTTIQTTTSSLGGGGVGGKLICTEIQSHVTNRTKDKFKNGGCVLPFEEVQGK